MIVNRPLAETVPIVLQRINEVLHMATLTDDIYWAHFDPQVQALRNVPFSDSKAHTLATLATQGFIIDMPIMGWNWDPVLVMQYRQQHGYTWVPSLLQPNIAVAPGVSQPGTAPYDPLHPPAGSIKVSLDANDYPPFQAPASSVPAPSPQAGTCWGNVCALGTGFPQNNFQDGYTFSENGKNYKLHVGQGPMGPTRWLELLP